MIDHLEGIQSQEMGAV